MKVSTQEEYGLRILMQLTKARLDGEYLAIQDIADAEKLSVQIVGRIMVVLKDGGLVDSAPTRKREYMLSRNPQAITLDEALTVLGGRLFDSTYCDEHSGVATADCVHACSCSLRPVWANIELIVSAVLRRISLADLLEGETALRSNMARFIQDNLAKKERQFNRT